MKGIIGQPEWCFPESGGKGNSGVNSGMPDSFRTEPLDSLIRECCQNSLDAAFAQKTVTIEFKTFKIKASELPGISELRKHIVSCHRLAKRKGSIPLKQVYTRANKIIKQDEYICLRVSDFNTTGLRGSREKESPECDSQWINCVRSTGSSGGKNDNSAGSQGLGKSTTYYNSAIRTVFFNTLDIDGNEASEGVSWLVSHSLDGYTTLDGVGYFSCTQDGQKCRAIFNQTAIDPNFCRKEPGTDVFIIGFNNNEDDPTEDLDTVAKCIVIDSFLPAIREGRLIVKTDQAEISNKTLPDIMRYLNSDSVPKRRQNNARNNVEFNKVMDSDAPSTTFETGKLGVGGQFELRILNGNGFSKKIAIYREIGMKIKEHRKKVSFDFAGVLTIRGNELNLLMKNMETAAHDNWQPNVYVAKSKRDTASKIISSLKEYINTALQKYDKTDETERTDSGLGELLPDTNDPSNDEGTGLGMIRNDNSLVTGCVDTMTPIRNSEISGIRNKESDTLTEDENGDISDDEFLRLEHKCRIDNLNPDHEPNPDPTRSILTDDDGTDEISKKYLIADVQVLKKDMIPLDKKGNRFLVRFFPTISSKKAMIKFNVAGETGGYKLPIIEASGNNGPLCIKNQNTVTGLRLIKNKEFSLKVTLFNNLFKSFSVSVYAYKEK